MGSDEREMGRNVRLDLIKCVTCLLIVFLHNTIFTEGGQISSGYDITILFFHALTRVGVPTFMGLSGFLLFYNKERSFEYGWMQIGRYAAMLLIWEIVYLLFGFISNTDIKWSGLIDYISKIDITCNHLWYLKLYILILLCFPIIRSIVRNQKVVQVYSLFWLFQCTLYNWTIRGGSAVVW